MSEVKVEVEFKDGNTERGSGYNMPKAIEDAQHKNELKGGTYLIKKYERK